MKCVIIEDEQHAGEHLEYLLLNSGYDIVILARIESVKKAVEWLRSNTVDLIFLDIHLSDGLSFEIFDQVQITTPVIFCTAYDEYTLKAFSVNSISYLLKPVDEKELGKAMQKFTLLKEKGEIPDYSALNSGIKRFQQRFLISAGNSLISIPAEDIAYIFTSNKIVIIVTKDGGQHLFDATLDQMEKRLNPEVFFRINRQFVVSMHAIQKMNNESRGRVKIETNPPAREEMIVSIDRANEFKSWLNR